MRQILVPLFLLVLISCNEMTQFKSEPVIIVAPESKPTNFVINDSSFLKIKIQNEKYEILFMNTPSTINGINALDTFLQKNKDLLDKDKVVVTGFENDKKFKAFKDLLLKYGISKFRINSE
jgi:hypothetical protein